MKPKTTPQFTQFRNAAFRAVAKAKVGSFMNLNRAQRIMNNRSDEFRSTHARQLRGEGKHQHRIHPGARQQLQSRLQRRNQPGARFRT